LTAVWLISSALHFSAPISSRIIRHKQATPRATPMKS
jgi:hypothetical protein